MFNNILFHSQNRLTLPKSKGFGRLYNWYAASSRSYGMLYNWYAATDVRNVAPVGWHVPSKVEYEILIAYLGGNNLANGKLKEVGNTYWNSPNTGATNEVGFNGIGAGVRTHVYESINEQVYFWTSTSVNSYNAYAYPLRNLNTYTGITDMQKLIGDSIRLIKDDSTDTGIMTGNDGKQYATVKIGTQVWMSENLEETKFRNGDTIPVVTDNAAWAALTTAGSCWYNNTRTYNLAPVGWHLPNLEYDVLISYLGGASAASVKLKEVGTTHWANPNNADNSTGFTMLANGHRSVSGFNTILTNSYLCALPNWYAASNTGAFDKIGLQVSVNKIFGAGIRFIRNINSVLTTNPTDSEGNSYETVTIGTQTWTKQNHKSKKWRTGESINVQDIYTDNAWAELTIPACCAYNNDENNV